MTCCCGGVPKPGPCPEKTNLFVTAAVVIGSTFGLSMWNTMSFSQKIVFTLTSFTAISTVGYYYLQAELDEIFNDGSNYIAGAFSSSSNENNNVLVTGDSSKVTDEE